MINPLLTTDIGELNGDEIFSHLPPTRVGDCDRDYMNEVLHAGFGNWESADIQGRFEAGFAEKFGVPYAVTHNSGSEIRNAMSVM